MQLNLKLFNVKINDRKVAIAFVATVLLGKFSKDVLTALIPFEWGILVYLKNHSRGESIFSCENGGLSIEREGKHCFSLVMYGFCSSNALYSASLSFRMFFLTPLETWNCYHFALNSGWFFL